jgi:hypothetical protein
MKAYDQTPFCIGHLDKTLDEAQAKGCTAVDRKDNGKMIYPFEKK